MKVATKKTPTKLAGATKTDKKEEIFYDENGKRISRLGFFFKKMQRKPMVEIIDMRAVLK